MTLTSWPKALGLCLSFLFFAPISFAAAIDDQTPVTLDPLSAHKNLTGVRPWRAPDFAEQTSAAGWSENSFAIPKGLEGRVQFWMDIYTRYTTSQGVIHDAEDVDLIYEVVDFRDVDPLPLPLSFKEKLKRQLVEEAKQRAIATLKRVAVAKSPDELTPAEKRVWAHFLPEKNPHKYEEAMEPSRLRFQLGQKDRMESAIFLSGRYLEDFEKIFRQEGLPIELTRIVFVESSFNVLARSKVGASGLWQLMPSVAKPYHLIKPAIDGRNHPLTATRVAAKLLAANYKLLGSWPLAVTGYNHGANGVRKIVEKYQTKDLADLIENVRTRASFGFASRNFYASFLAAKEVEKNADKYFPQVSWSKRMDTEELKLPQTIKYADLLTWYGYDDHQLQIFNPHLTWRTRKGFGIPAGTPIAIPSPKYSQALLSLGRKKREIASVSDPIESFRIHKVSRGENLTTIARSYGISLRDLLQENGFEIEKSLRPGQRIRIPR